MCYGSVQFNCAIKSIQIDGGEFVTLKHIVEKFGIVHRQACPHTFEQNGVIECKYRRIVEKGLVLLH